MYTSIHCVVCGAELAANTKLECVICETKKGIDMQLHNVEFTEIDNMEDFYARLKQSVTEYCLQVDNKVTNLLKKLHGGFFGVRLTEDLAMGFLESLCADGAYEEDGQLVFT